MKRFYFILLGLSLLITSCSKDKLVEEKLINVKPPGWHLNFFYIDNIDLTDSLLLVTTDSLGHPWFYRFEGDIYLVGPWGNGTWYVSDKGTKLRTRVHYYDLTRESPFLTGQIDIIWDLNYKKLINDDELWLVTNFNNKKYEAHFYSQ